MRFWFPPILAVLCFLAPVSASGVELFSPSEIELGSMEEGREHGFSLRLKNTSGRDLKIQMVVTSCGCALASPADTFVAADAELELDLRLDTRGKLGAFEKTVTITTNAGIFQLLLRAEAFHPSKDPVDKTAIFREPCSRCHSATNLAARPVNELYASLCDTCHGGVDGFWKGRHEQTREALVNIVSSGVMNASMPGFANAAGGPLPAARVGELADYLLKARQMQAGGGPQKPGD